MAQAAWPPNIPQQTPQSAKMLTRCFIIESSRKQEDSDSRWVAKRGQEESWQGRKAVFPSRNPIRIPSNLSRSEIPLSLDIITRFGKIYGMVSIFSAEKEKRHFFGYFWGVCRPLSCFPIRQKRLMQGRRVVQRGGRPTEFLPSSVLWWKWHGAIPIKGEIGLKPAQSDLVFFVGVPL